MNLYRILLPKDQAKLATWKTFVLDLAGGFTQYNVAQGMWRDPQGLPVGDLMVPFEVAVNHPAAWATIVDKAFELFPKEQAIMFALVGEATIAFRPSKAA
jgi:hypothetical protein